MLILDENFPENQRQLLLKRRMAVRQVGYEVGRKGLKDNEIVSLLYQLQNPTFFTLDSDFYKPKLCHLHYCLVYLDVGQNEAAFFVRRFMRQPGYKTYNQRKGKVIRISHIGISVWLINAERETHTDWQA